MKKEICHEENTNISNTDGSLIKKRVCYCGTTACLKSTINSVSSIQKDCDCVYEMGLKDGFCKKCEERFYEKVLKTNILR